MKVFTALTEHTGLLEDLLQTLSEYPDYELWVTGQSLGGTLASLAAGKLVKEFHVPEENLKLVTFGQPRTGDEEWAREMDNIVIYFYFMNDTLKSLFSYQNLQI